MERPTCIRTYANQFEAETARSTLDAEGIDASLSSDDVSGGIPSAFATGGIRLVVAEADVDQAIAILTSASSQRRSNDESVDELARMTWRRSILPGLILSGGAALALLVHDVAPTLRLVIAVIAALIAFWVRRTV